MTCSKFLSSSSTRVKESSFSLRETRSSSHMYMIMYIIMYMIMYIQIVRQKNTFLKAATGPEAGRVTERQSVTGLTFKTLSVHEVTGHNVMLHFQKQQEVRKIKKYKLSSSSQTEVPLREKYRFSDLRARERLLPRFD
ncbi:hypothetical protein F2P81_017664 [Scophthalmus maximus]|uniref:Uncharacterized protein n=1 Tax=Scophthalmus maximus TaxID=52904 RepID=A0A6A4S9L1_SCOMX|nr:hypothetical protein F2P81_017664 [Scophthalmus maximus]